MQPDTLVFEKMAQKLSLPLNEMVLIDDFRKNVEVTKRSW
jgi:predicted enzyme involved in methoxymalonyl-ACP biosynthesis